MLLRYAKIAFKSSSFRVPMDCHGIGGRMGRPAPMCLPRIVVRKHLFRPDTNAGVRVRGDVGRVTDSPRTGPRRHARGRSEPRTGFQVRRRQLGVCKDGRRKRVISGSGPFGPNFNGV